MTQTYIENVSECIRDILFSNDDIIALNIKLRAISIHEAMFYNENVNNFKG